VATAILIDASRADVIWDDETEAIVEFAAEGVPAMVMVEEGSFAAKPIQEHAEESLDASPVHCETNAGKEAEAEDV
jgi:hypothetical protein